MLVLGLDIFTKRITGMNNQEYEQVSKLVFYAQSTGAAISGRWSMNKVYQNHKAWNTKEQEVI